MQWKWGCSLSWWATMIAWCSASPRSPNVRSATPTRIDREGLSDGGKLISRWYAGRRTTSFSRASRAISEAASAILSAATFRRSHHATRSVSSPESPYSR